MFIIAGLVIVGFTIFLDPTIGGRGFDAVRGTSGGLGSINGRPLSQAEYEQARTEARLAFRVAAGTWPESDATSRSLFNLEVGIQRRLLLQEKLAELNIRPTDEAVAEQIASHFRDPQTGAFRLEAYQQFVRTELAQSRGTENQFRRFIRNEVGAMHLYSLAGLSGSLVTPREVERLYRQENEQFSAEVVLFQASNHLANVVITPEALDRFYTNSMARYRTPERVQVSYVTFAATNFPAEAGQLLAEEPNLAERLEQAYQQAGADFFKDDDGNTLPHDAAIEKMRAQQLERAAMISALRAAFGFMEKVYDAYQQPADGTDPLDRYAREAGYEVSVTEPFGYEGPESLNVSDAFVEAAFALTPERPIPGEPLPGEESAYYVIALKQRFPSEIQTLEAVRDQVTEDYRMREAVEAAHRAGAEFYATLTNALARGDTFEAACGEANVTVHKLPSFSLGTATQPEGWNTEVNLNVLKEEMFRLSPGEVTRFMPAAGGGYVGHLTARRPVDDTVMQAGLPAFAERVREQRRRQALSDWLLHEFEQTRIELASSRDTESE